MIVRAVDEENDWTFGKSKNNYKNELMALAQNAKCRLNCFLGDCYFNLSGGIDWFNLIGSKEFLRMRLEISTCLRNTYGVKEITNLTIDYDEERNYTISYSLDTIYGELENEFLEVP